jgi:hypothetical protein
MAEAQFLDWIISNASLKLTKKNTCLVSHFNFILLGKAQRAKQHFIHILPLCDVDCAMQTQTKMDEKIISTLIEPRPNHVVEVTTIINLDYEFLLIAGI